MTPRRIEWASTSFATLLEKAAWMDAGASLDARDIHVESVATLLAGRSYDPHEIAGKIQRWVRDRIRYSHDPLGVETTPDSRVILEAGTEDCDGKARLFVALVRSLRRPDLDARLRSVWDRSAFTHAQAEVSVDGGPWTIAELIVRDLSIGEGAHARSESPEIV